MEVMGFVMMQRDILNWGWYSDPLTSQLYHHCNYRASYTDTEWRGISIKKGQFLTSVEKLSQELGQTQQNIKTRLNRLKKENIIDIKTTNKYTVITLLIQGNWRNLENETNKQTNKQNNKQTNKQLTSKQQTTNKQLTTDNKGNKENKEKNKKEKIPQSNKFDSGNELNSLSNSHSESILFFVGNDEFRVTSEMIQSFTKRFRKPYQKILDELGDLKSTLLNLDREIYIGEDSVFFNFVDRYLDNPDNYFSSSDIKKYFNNL